MTHEISVLVIFLLQILGHSLRSSLWYSGWTQWRKLEMVLNLYYGIYLLSLELVEKNPTFDSTVQYNN